MVLVFHIYPSNAPNVMAIFVAELGWIESRLAATSDVLVLALEECRVTEDMVHWAGLRVVGALSPGPGVRARCEAGREVWLLDVGRRDCEDG